MPGYSMVANEPDFFIIDKMPGCSFHKDAGHTGVFIELEKALGCKLWPVHRLDKMTSGLLILAKSADAARQFGEYFEQNSIDKTYLAISDKKPKKKQGKICGDMKKSRQGSWILTKTQTNPALTQFYSQSIEPSLRLFWVMPKTGKTHQIRVALKSIGSPILGDSRYGGTDSDRGYLHAYRLSFHWKTQQHQYHCPPSQGSLFNSEAFCQALKSLEAKLNTKV